MNQNENKNHHHHPNDDECQKSPIGIVFSSSEKKHKKSLTIKDVFYASVNFRWNEPDNDFF
jgi:hypothetical protein